MKKLLLILLLGTLFTGCIYKARNYTCTLTNTITGEVTVYQNTKCTCRNGQIHLEDEDAGHRTGRVDFCSIYKVDNTWVEKEGYVQ